MKILFVTAICIVLTACGSRELNYNSYQQQIQLCKNIGMDIFVRKGVRDNNVYVEGVSCRDEYGAMWPVENL